MTYTDVISPTLFLYSSCSACHGRSKEAAPGDIRHFDAASRATAASTTEKRSNETSLTDSSVRFYVLIRLANIHFVYVTSNQPHSDFDTHNE